MPGSATDQPAPPPALPPSRPRSLPKLRVCFAHGGGALPYTIGRIQHGFDVRPDLCAVDCPTSPRDQLGRFWSDSLVHDADALRLALRVFGEDRVCLGTDYPFPLGEYTAESRGMDYAAGELIASVPDLDDGLRAKLLGGNALEWLGKTAEDFHR
jgi:aminocarboxymuconate-semialdehyde decarboxylase